ncbi:MAG TPA: RNA polymerase subunit sigma-54 [Mesotoga infera]|jgi:RNA polymerase sigma-54 factor|uniref:Sigma-54 DNA-binding domain protein n=1 Tax=Mesotoga infera TaxID=1236046 RepID=A0A7Z7LG26_9BACT|nr:RNA polymerase subunit sigma-54 [Mesotoga sp.]NLI05825.1 RNA polymerase subunit sigma-54 [Thermotogaceae bacterium]SSC13422.1 Sigma-54 DNA-binding domain protein [Mesotoga infera]HNR79170.1 RNA polymerase subunit sigma-54 [Mesotoga infera]HNS66356.1 RNA polymerase subunit sigma-54 [Mesotoga infera]
MELGHEVSQKLEQRQGLSLRSQQALRLLQLNSQEINAELEEIVQANPLLEIKRDDYDLIEDGEDKEKRNEDEENAEDGDLYSQPIQYSVYMREESSDREGWDFDRLEPQQPTFREILKDFAYYILDDRQYSLFETLLDNMDDHGLLSRDLEAIAKEVACSLEELDSIIEALRESGFDGVFARNREELDDLMDSGFFPSSGYSDGAFVRYVEPDLYIEFFDEKFMVTVRDCSLILNIEDSYREILENGQKDARDYLENKLEEAQFFISALERRKTTLLAIGNEIVMRNAVFLLNRGDKIRPLKMNEIADKLGVVVSTVSRAVKGKFIQTPVGTFPLRYFFGNLQEKEQALEIIAEIVKNNEEISDSRLVSELNNRGISIARRTVNKYRNLLGLGKDSQS